MQKPFYPKPRGFSLLEIVIGLVVLGVLGVVSSNMISSSVFTNQVLSNEYLTYANARTALERMSREVRELKFNTTGAAMVTGTPSSADFAFTKAGLTTDTSVSLHYNNSNKTITLSYDGGATPYTLLTNYSGSTSGPFSYYDANGVATADWTKVRYVGIDLSVTPNNATQPLRLSNLVNLRNRP